MAGSDKDKRVITLWPDEHLIILIERLKEALETSDSRMVEDVIVELTALQVYLLEKRLNGEG